MTGFPKHIAIIMDGNGRWAQSNGHHRFFGHVRGARVAKRIIEHCALIGIEHLTLFAFSTENWKRPKDEVNILMKLLFTRLNKETPSLVKNNIQFHCVGDLDKLPKFVNQSVLNTKQKTAECNGMKLTFALSYGGKQELVNSFKKISEQISSGESSIEDINEDLISKNLESSFLPDPDLILRTSGESRLSNFFLWQAAYSEIMIISKMWPDFSCEDLDTALNDFKKRSRRFGNIEHSTAINQNLNTFENSVGKSV